MLITPGIPRLQLCCLNLGILHQQKTFPSGQNGSVRVDTLSQSRQRHGGGGSLRAQHLFNASRSISPSDPCFTVSSASVGHQLQTISLALWLTVTIHWNRFIGYELASGSQWDGCCYDNLSSRSIYLCARCNSLFTNYTGLQGDW
jgi:hypothetical protein